jgi:predicted transcriptional regulator
MARYKDREKALVLRKEGKSYSQIKKILKVSKSTLSVWLKDYPLSKQRIRELRDHNEQRIEKFRETMRKKKEERLRGFFEEQKRLIFPFTKRELFLLGLFLYWGEGSKNQSNSLSISNTDPSIINFFIFWVAEVLKVPRTKIKVQLHLYKDMNVNDKINYWSKTLKIPRSQFTKPYIKKTISTRINHKGSFGQGTCNIRAGGVRLSERILMSLKAVSDKYSRTRV